MVDYQRKQYVVKRTFQLRYTYTILVFVLLAVFLTGLTTYLSIFPYLSEKLSNVYPQNRLIKIIADANMRLVYVSFVLVPIALWIGLSLSHKVAGPWHRLEKLMRDVANGKVVEEVKLRKGDELGSLAEAINRVVEQLQTSRGAAHTQISEIESNIRNLESELNRQQPDLNSVKQIIKSLENLLAGIKSHVT